ncbi:MAG: hypothetical protein IJW59_04955 [Clostridia bacterium]|nr:hypothetical protein [Clostridia bacterium]
MENLINLIKLLSNSNKPQQQEKQKIPKEIIDQYPYGEFPIRYTRTGQEDIRKNSENRFSYTEQRDEKTNLENNFDLQSILPLLQMLGKKGNTTDILKTISSLIFKDQPELQKIFELLPQTKSKDTNHSNNFPDLNKVNIASLKRVK